MPSDDGNLTKASTRRSLWIARIGRESSTSDSVRFFFPFNRQTVSGRHYRTLSQVGDTDNGSQTRARLGASRRHLMPTHCISETPAPVTASQRSIIRTRTATRALILIIETCQSHNLRGTRVYRFHQPVRVWEGFFPSDQGPFVEQKDC